MQLRILWVGKTKSAPIRMLLEDYAARLGRLLPCAVVELADPGRKKGLRGAALQEAEAQQIRRSLLPDSRKVALDGRGREYSSVEFARWLETESNRGTKSIEFVIGGPEGLSNRLLDQVDLMLSLGRMTWTHEMSRVLLLEQVYRAQSILRNMPYHK